MSSPFVYFTRDKFFHYEDEKSVSLTSQYLESYQKNVQQINRKKEWKQKSDLSMMGQMQIAPNSSGNVPHEFHGGTFTGTEVLYAISVENSSGLFRTRPGIAAKAEGHIVHNSDRRFASPSYSEKRDDIIYSVLEPDGTENLHLMHLADESEQELTEGDSSDSFPRWAIDGSNRVVYQTAGIGRDTHGNFAMMGPSCLNILDFDDKEIIEVNYSEQHDYIMPVLNKDTIYAIRRPYETGKRKSFTILDLLKIPVNIVKTLFSWVNYNSMMFRGKPLSEGMKGRQEEIQQKMILHGNLVDAEKELAVSRKRGDSVPAIVPRSWCLVSITDEGEETIIEEGVIAFDIEKNGDILFSNGSGIFRKSPGGKRELLFKEKLVQRIVAAR